MLSHISLAVALGASAVVATNVDLPFLDPGMVIDVDSLCSQVVLKIDSDIGSYALSVASDSSAKDYLKSLAAAYPPSCIDNGLDDLPESCYATTTPDWFAALPTPVQAFAASFVSAEAAIVSSDYAACSASGGMPTMTAVGGGAGLSSMISSMMSVPTSGPGSSGSGSGTGSGSPSGGEGSQPGSGSGSGAPGSGEGSGSGSGSGSGPAGAVTTAAPSSLVTTAINALATSTLPSSTSLLTGGAAHKDIAMGGLVAIAGLAGLLVL